ncbi:hypothetical protein GCM10023324_16790 [Streptomyces youssoufiensis]
MGRLTATLPYLDQTGRVYVPLAGPGGTCLKLNRYASELWRKSVGQEIDLSSLTDTDRRFLHGFVENGFLRLEDAAETT